jgi:hypothetical protein
MDILKWIVKRFRTPVDRDSMDCEIFRVSESFSQIDPEISSDSSISLDIKNTLRQVSYSSDENMAELSNV